MKKIIIVEDDPDTLDLMEIILRDCNYIVIKVNREISVKEIYSIKPDLIIIDFLLPFGLGTELCLNIKSNHHTKEIPVLMYSANNDIEKLAKDNGADAYIAKPFDIDDMVHLVEKTIQPTYAH